MRLVTRRRGLGNATAGERSYQGTLQTFDRGFMVQSDSRVRPMRAPVARQEAAAIRFLHLAVVTDN